MSLGSPLYTEELADAIAYATEHGNTIVVASGNDRMVSRFVAYPAADPNTLSVSATDVPASGDPTDVRSASFANVGPHRGPSTSRKERRAASRSISPRRGWLKKHNSTAARPRSPERVWLRPTWPARPHSSRRRASTTQPSAFERPLDRSRTSRRRSRDTASLDIQAALQNDQPEDEPADVLTDDAELRDDIFRGEAAARGSWLATFL